MKLVSQTYYNPIYNSLTHSLITITPFCLIDIRAKYHVTHFETGETLFKSLNFNFRMISPPKEVITNRGDLMQDTIYQIIQPFLYIQCECVIWDTLLIKINGQIKDRFTVPLTNILRPLCKSDKCSTSFKKGCALGLGFPETSPLHKFKIFGVADYYASGKEEPLKDRMSAKYIKRLTDLFTRELFLPSTDCTVRYERTTNVNKTKKTQIPYISYLT